MRSSQRSAVDDRGMGVMGRTGTVGPPPLASEVVERFWSVRSSGVGSAQSAELVGIGRKTAYSLTVARGGIRPRPRSVPTGRFLSLAEREEIAIGKAQGKPKAQIARELGRSTSTVTREIARNATYGRKGRYRAVNAELQARLRAKRPKPAKLHQNLELRAYVQRKLSAKQWSPAQISHALVEDFPDRPEMRVSHETIYQSLYVQSRGALRRELTACLRTGRAVRRPKKRAEERRGRIPGM